MTEKQGKQPVTGPEHGGRRTLYQRMHLIPQRVGILIAIALIVISIPVGNARELNKKMAAAQRVWDGKATGLAMSQIVEGRVADAANLLTIMKRYPKTATPQRDALEAASQQLQKAHGVSATARASQELEAALLDASDALLQEQSALRQEDQQLVKQVVDSASDHRAKQVVLARDYNREAENALKAYESMPARLFLSKPELFELRAQ